MKLSNRTRLCRALLITPFLVLLLLLPTVFSSGATNPMQQTPAVNAQDTSSPVSQRLTVTVTDGKGRFIAGLTKEDFTVWEGKTEREITYFNNAPQPTSIAVLIDASDSIKPWVLRAARYATTQFIKFSHPADEYFIGEFSDKWGDSIDWQDSQTVAEALNKLWATPPRGGSQPKRKLNGQTALYDACAVALESVMQRPNPKRILVLITDGLDNRSRHTFKQIRSKILASDVQVYGIGIKATVIEHDTTLDIAGQAILDELAWVSGGQTFFPQYSDRGELEGAVKYIASRLRDQYVLGFTPTNAAGAGKLNNLKVKLTPRDKKLNNLYVRTREGYFTPPHPAP